MNIYGALNNVAYKSELQFHELRPKGVADALAEQEIQRNTNLNGDGSQGSGSGITRPVRPTCECTYNDFLKCQPLNFKGTKGVVGLTQCFERMEIVFHISNCAVENQVKFATCTLLSAALTCTVQEELALMCGRMFPEEYDEVEKYVGGLPDMIQAENKRKFDNNNQAQQQLPKRQNVAQAYATGTGERKEYARTLPLCNKCKFHHNGPCIAKTITCYECGNQGHYKSDCLELKNRNHGNQAEGTEARGMVYAL
ncbi:putative reverse transcriptase domain-containing protein [Tanacetum coccineum]